MYVQYLVNNCQVWDVRTVNYRADIQLASFTEEPREFMPKVLTWPFHVRALDSCHQYLERFFLCPSYQRFQQISISSAGTDFINLF